VTIERIVRLLQMVIDRMQLLVYIICLLLAISRNTTCSDRLLSHSQRKYIVWFDLDCMKGERLDPLLWLLFLHPLMSLYACLFKIRIVLLIR
jgi:hypothetical protein